ncbi:MAG: efflux RND transporter periplasmic adaptor subunit [Acidobacteria bacterium]|nr:efflux RND transporter periplasmic adaptor subunit [Acidobacteriota bacterium]
MRFICSVAALAFLTQTSCTSLHTEAASKPPAERERQAFAGSRPVILASPGRIEGRSDTIEVGAAIEGVVAAVHVKEGQRVFRDAVLAEIGCPDLRASLHTAFAVVDSSRQVRARLLRGSRDEERQASEQRSFAAKAVLDQASAHLKRTKELAQAGVMARSVLDEAQRDFEVAEARLREALRHEALVKAPPMQEDIAKADADIRASENRLVAIEQQITKCTVKAPISGTILRVMLRPGESFSTVTPKPLFTIADLSGRRVRAEVDEKDVGKVAPGQKVIVRSDALGDRKFTGTVTQLASTMGRKRVYSGEPTEKSDRDILEVTADLDESAGQLPLGLRVVVQFLASGGS